VEQAAQHPTKRGKYGLPGDYVTGANINGFRRVAEAMLAHGVL
jgi:glutamate dehydrogenase (NADP+)